MTDRKEIIDRLRAQLALGSALRRAAAADAVLDIRRARLRLWQSGRLARTHADLLHHERYHPAALFFLSDLYGTADLARRTAEAERLIPVMAKLLPTIGLEVVADAVELDTLSESLDADMAAALDEIPIDDEAYGAAYRSVGRQEERRRQIDLLSAVGTALDGFANLPLAGETLRMMRRPARFMGFGELQDFLERGFAAFRVMAGAEEFVALIFTRETRLSDALFAGETGLLGLAATAWPAED